MKRIICCLLVFALGACNAYDPVIVENASVQLAFERDLNNLGDASLSASAEDGKAKFKSSPTGKAFFAEGDGRWVEITADESLSFGALTQISFDLKRADWKNPYGPGSSSQTPLVLTGRTTDRLEHIIFNTSSVTDSRLYVSFKDVDGEKQALSTSNGATKAGRWRHIALLIDRGAGTTQLQIDGETAASVDAVPVLTEYGIQRIKLGTWHKQNQAFRGWIDNVVIAAGDGTG